MAASRRRGGAKPQSFFVEAVPHRTSFCRSVSKRSKVYAGDASAVAESWAMRSLPRRVKPLLDTKPAYDKHDKAIAAARKKDYAQARQLAGEAAAALPKEGRFQQTLGEIALAGEGREESHRVLREGDAARS